MVFYKREILLDKSVSGDTGTYYLQILLTQDVDDLGIYEDDDDSDNRNNLIDNLFI